MKCYYHEDRDAVGTCQDCGKALCRDCASKYTPVLCPDCAQRRQNQRVANQQERKRKHLASVEKEFKSTLIPACVIGGIVFIFFIVMLILACMSKGFSLSILGYYIGNGIGIGLLMFGFLYGFKATAGLCVYDVNNFAANLLSFLFIRIGLSLIIGLPIFVWSLIKYLKGKEANRKM